MSFAASHVVLGFSLFVACGCSDPDDGDDDYDDNCPNPAVTALVPDALAIGSGFDDRFAAYVEGQEVRLVEGPQGGFMIPLGFRIDTSAITTDGVCAHLDITANVESGLGSVSTSFTMSRRADSGQYWYDTTFMFLSDAVGELAYKPCHLSVVFRDLEYSTTAEVGVVLFP